MSEQSKNNLAPHWLKPEIFERVLKETVKDYKCIRSFQVNPGTKPGDNYASEVLRIIMLVELTNGETKQISYVLKIPCSSETFKEISSSYNIFNIENKMFTIYVEEFKDLYRNMGLEIEFGPKCYTLDVTYDHVLLEDLQPLGFTTMARTAGIDIDHTLSFLKKLAQWHAASAVRVATKGAYPVEQTSGLFTDRDRPFMHAMTDDLVKYVLFVLPKLEGYEAYFDDVKNMEGHIYNGLLELAKPKPDEFNVLNHGDCWVNNIMFRHDDSGRVLETYLVDYQLPFFGNAALDLIYFIISSTKLENKLKDFDYFIKYYHDQLIKHLSLLKYTKKPPTLIDLHASLLTFGLYGYYTACGTMSGALLENTAPASFDNIFADTSEAAAVRKQLYSGKTFREHLSQIMPWLQNRGALQCCNIKKDNK